VQEVERVLRDRDAEICNSDSFCGLATGPLFSAFASPVTISHQVDTEFHADYIGSALAVSLPPGSEIAASIFSRSPVGNHLRGLLLRHAVHCAKAPYEITGIDRYDLAGRKDFRQRVECDPIVGAIEDWHEHDSIRNVEIRVTGG
jgi:hypothetical protein